MQSKIVRREVFTTSKTTVPDASVIGTNPLGLLAVSVIDIPQSCATDAVNAEEMHDYVEKELDHTEQKWEGGNKTILQFMQSQTTLNEKFVDEMQQIAVSQAEMRKDIEHLGAE